MLCQGGFPVLSIDDQLFEDFDNVRIEQDPGLPT
jgi:hypothetical protein